MVRVRALRAVAGCMDLACVDLAVVWGVDVGEWARGVAGLVSADLKHEMRVLDAFFGHFFCLRDAALVVWGEGHPALQSWPALCDEVRGLPVARTAELIGVSLALRLEVHGLLTRDQQVDESRRLAADEAARRRALEQLLDNDHVYDRRVRHDVFDLNGDVDALRTRLTRVLEAFGPLAEPGEVAPLNPAGDWPPDAVAAYPLITGRVCPGEDRDVLASAREVVFLACGHLGEKSSVGRWDDRCFVYFEPAEPHTPTGLSSGAGSPAPGVHAALQALANEGRLTVLATIAAAGEMYAKEVVAATGLPQPTVAGHLATLIEAGLVRSERRGHRRYYAPVPEAGRQVAEAIRRVFGI